MGLKLANAYAQTSGPITDTGRNFIVTAWARLTGNAATATVVTQEGARTGGFTLQYSKPDDRWALVRAGSDADGAATVKALSAAAPRLNEWTHLAGVYDSAARQISLYVNGRLESTVAATSPWNAAGPLTIGRGKINGAAADPWTGDLDEVRVYGRAMFADELADLVNSAATLVGHWTLDEESGLTAADSSGRATPATLSGAASWTAGWLDGALALDGVNGYAQTTAPAIGTRSSFTVAAWVQLDYLPTTDTAAVAQPGSRTAGFQLGFDKEQQRWTLGMRAADTDTATLVRTRSDAIPNPLEWTHVAGVYDALAGDRGRRPHVRRRAERRADRSAGRPVRPAQHRRPPRSGQPAVLRAHRPRGGSDRRARTPLHRRRLHLPGRVRGPAAVRMGQADAAQPGLSHDRLPHGRPGLTDGHTATSLVAVWRMSTEG
ncbi:LamG domain-containing protein [Nonomuraea sp. NPDC049625]|uniref:LamG domain-containing protein n=1 Tax=Nonomuraea sp. NPDC049625 TaxID=3155775 RepID=UPI003447B771